MKFWQKLLFPWGVLIVLIVINVLAHLKIDEEALIEPQFKDIVNIPSSEGAIKALSLGFETFAADLYLIKTQIYIHEHQNDPDALPTLTKMFDVITTLDPYYKEAYFLAYHTLSNFYDLMGVAEAVRLLKKGWKYIDDCDFPRYLGVAYYVYSTDPITAATYLKCAIATNRGKRWCYEGLIWMADAAAQKKKAGVCVREKIVCSQLKETKTHRVSKRFINLLSRRCVGLHILCELKKGIEAYKIKFAGKCPKDIQELLKGLGVEGEIPPEPFGGYFFIDEQCEPRSSTGLHPIRKKKSHSKKIREQEEAR